MHKLLDDYIAQTAPRFLAKPREAGVSEQDEMRQHLYALMEGHHELGLDENDAARAAIAQFGAAKKVRRDLQRVALRGAFRDRAFWQAAFVAAAAQILLNLAGKAMLGFDGNVTAAALVQFYSDRRVNIVFTLVWLSHLLIVGFITSRLAPRYAPLAATCFSIYQAFGFVVAGASLLMHLSPAYLIAFIFLIVGPPVLYALTAWLFVRRRAAQPLLAKS